MGLSKGRYGHQLICFIATILASNSGLFWSAWAYSSRRLAPRFVFGKKFKYTWGLFMKFCFGDHIWWQLQLGTIEQDCERGQDGGSRRFCAHHSLLGIPEGSRPGHASSHPGKLVLGLEEENLLYLHLVNHYTLVKTTYSKSWSHASYPWQTSRCDHLLTFEVSLGRK